VWQTLVLPGSGSGSGSGSGRTADRRAVRCHCADGVGSAARQLVVRIRRVVGRFAHRRAGRAAEVAGLVADVACTRLKAVSAVSRAPPGLRSCTSRGSAGQRHGCLRCLILATMHGTYRKIQASVCTTVHVSREQDQGSGSMRQVQDPGVSQGRGHLAGSSCPSPECRGALRLRSRRWRSSRSSGSCHSTQYSLMSKMDSAAAPCRLRDRRVDGHPCSWTEPASRRGSNTT